MKKAVRLRVNKKYIKFMSSMRKELNSYQRQPFLMPVARIVFTTPGHAGMPMATF